MTEEQLHDIKMKAHHSISKLLGLTKPECCPKCGSDQFFRYVEIIKTYKDFTCGHADFLDEDYQFTSYACDDCEYEHD